MLRRPFLGNAVGVGLCVASTAAGAQIAIPGLVTVPVSRANGRLQLAEATLPSARIGSPPATVATIGPMTMVLDVSINGSPTNQLLTVKRSPDGSFSGNAGELRRIRMKVDPRHSDADEVAFSDLPGVVVRYDAAGQSLAIQVPDALLDTYDVELGGGRRVTDLSLIKPTPGMLLNYSLYASRASRLTSFSGNVEAVAMTRVGIFSTTALFNSHASSNSNAVVRLDSAWRLVDPGAVRSYMIGDFASNALSWTGSVRLGGFQISSAFDQRPDLVTNALPQFSGSAALPSTLDLFVNQQKVYSGAIPSGPFDLKSLPNVSNGNVELVTTDATGRQVSITKSYYYVSGQLRRGVFEYSLDVGAPRRDYGLKSFSYDETVFASASVRYGVNGNITLEGHAEASADGLVNGGVGMVKTLGGVGAVTTSVAASSYKGSTGAKIAVEGEALVKGVRVFAGTERTLGTYFDLSRVSIMRQSKRYGTYGTDYGAFLSSTAQASAIDRAGIAFTPWFDRTSVSLSYNRIKSPGSSMSTGSLSLSRSLGDRVSIYTNGYMNLDKSKDYGLFATVNIRLGSNINVSAGVDHSGGRTGYNLQATGTTGQRQGDVGWGLADREVQGGDARRSAYATWLAPQAQLRAQVDQSGGNWRGSAQADGSIVIAGGGVFLADRIGQAFAIVKNAGPNVEVIQGGVAMGRSNSAGRALLPNITPYYEQQIFIDPATLPDGWEPAVTERVAVAGYRQGAIVDFGARIIHGAILLLKDKAGKVIAPGYVAQLQGGDSAVIGYDGQTYMRGLGPSNIVTVDLGASGICSVAFAYDVKGPAQPQIGPLTCQ